MKINIKYLLVATLLFVVEVVIARFTHDRIIRPYVGDVLISVFIYTFIKAFFDTKVLTTAVCVLYYCYAIEISQHFDLIGHLGLQNSRAAHLLLGSYFSWIDMVCYTVGILLVLMAESLEFKLKQAASA